MDDDIRLEPDSDSAGAGHAPVRCADALVGGQMLNLRSRHAPGYHGAVVDRSIFMRGPPRCMPEATTVSRRNTC